MILSISLRISFLLTIDSQEVKNGENMHIAYHFWGCLIFQMLFWALFLATSDISPTQNWCLTTEGCFEVEVSPIGRPGMASQKIGSVGPPQLGRPKSDAWLQKHIEKGRWYRNLAQKYDWSGVYGIWRGQQNAMVHINQNIQNGELKHHERKTEDCSILSIPSKIISIKHQ